MITSDEKQNEALETIMQGGTPEISKSVHVPTPVEDGEVGGEAYEDPDQDENGIYEHRPANAEEGARWYDDEGNVWEMGGGGPVKVSMFDDIRMPMFCPECGGIMNNRFDRKFWRIREMCMDCWQKRETKMKVEGTYELYEKRTLLENKKSWLRDIKQGIEEFEEEMTGGFEQVVNSSGDTVEFSGLEDEEIQEMIDNANEFIENFEEHIDDLEEEVQELEKQTE